MKFYNVRNSTFLEANRFPKIIKYTIVRIARLAFFIFEIYTLQYLFFSSVNTGPIFNM